MIVGGGPCACNPAPVARMFDAIVFGDGEKVCLDMADVWLRCKREGYGAKREILEQWRKIEGVYVPSFFDEEKIRIAGSETVAVRPTLENYTRIDRAIAADLNDAVFPEKPIVPFGKPVHDRLRIEVARGCSRGCRFCQAGMIYRPVRERSSAKLLGLADTCLNATGYEDISLLSLSTGDYTDIEGLLGGLMEKYGPRNIAVSLPSLRAGSLTRQLMEHIKKVRKTGFTIAPEAGSQRLRDVVNKNIDQDQVFRAIEDAVEAGWKVIKLYFMIGLPTETQDDLFEIVRLIETARKLKGSKGGKIKINASFTTFIPKPHTPFQWEGQAPLEYSRETIDMLKDRLKGTGVQVKWQHPETSRIEGLFARGDRNLAGLLEKAWENGCRLDGWSDWFRYDIWEQSAEQTGIDIDFFTTRARDLSEPLPWDHMNSRVDKSFLAEERKKAFRQETTEDCRDGTCQNCGICDFDRIMPVIAEGPRLDSSQDTDRNGCENDPAETKQIMAVYSKTGKARHFGHLEMVNIFLRAMRRARIPLAYSGGFHPMPKVSFEDPLPLGMESMKERFFAVVAKDWDESELAETLDGMLPEGLRIAECASIESRKKVEKDRFSLYMVILRNGTFRRERHGQFESRREWIFVKTGKKGKTRDIDLKKVVDMIEIVGENRVLLKISAEPGNIVRPSDILKHVFDMDEKAIKGARVIKLDGRKDGDVQATGDQRF